MRALLSFTEIRDCSRTWSMKPKETLKVSRYLSQLVVNIESPALHSLNEKVSQWLVSLHNGDVKKSGREEENWKKSKITYGRFVLVLEMNYCEYMKLLSYPQFNK